MFNKPLKVLVVQFLIVDIRMNGMTGLELQSRLIETKSPLPIVGSHELFYLPSGKAYLVAVRETQQVLDTLGGYECDEVQGFWLSPPLDAHACLAFIRNWRPVAQGAAAPSLATP